jgi:predicted PolB exonuclease-like 3'-5' exonuclease
MNTLVFDIETVPDVALGRRLYGLDGLADAQVARAMFALRRQGTAITAGTARVAAGGDFLPLEQHRVVAVSCALRSRDGFRVWSLGDLASSEAELVQRFFDGIEKFSPDLVSWNGSSFDLPVLTYRAMLAGVQAPRFWETGGEDPAFRYNNYVSRYHWRHTDLMDVLSGYQSRGRVSLANMACLLGLPGKLGFDGSQVWDAWQAGDIAGIRRYCETDVLNTWLIYLRFEQLRGRLSREQHADELARVRAYLSASQEPHFAEFLSAWQDGV